MNKQFKSIMSFVLAVLLLAALVPTASAAGSSKVIYLPKVGQSMNINLATKSLYGNNDLIFKDPSVTFERNGWGWSSLKMQVVDNKTKKVIASTDFTGKFTHKFTLKPDSSYTIKVTRTSDSASQLVIKDSFGLK